MRSSLLKTLFGLGLRLQAHPYGYAGTHFTPHQNVATVFLRSVFHMGSSFFHSRSRVQHFASKSEADARVSARMSQMQQLLNEAISRSSFSEEPIPKITLDHVKVGFARSGGPGGQNVNKVNTKVDMRFHVMSASWLPLRIREKILQMEKNRINKDGELVISSTKTRTQGGNIEDALEKLQAIIDAAAYVPPPPAKEKIKRMRKLAEVGEQNRLQAKKGHSIKKAARRNKGSWD